MKKIVFLALIQMLVYLSGCSSIYNLLLTSANTDNTSIMVGTATLSLPKEDTSDFFLPVTPRTALNIDLECIVDYVQGTAVDTFTPLPNHATPFIRYQIRF